ncbi:MAG: lysophospholipase [Chloroflexi bacterium]|nr:lysophospholipase [Chloroflexota bacterium]
METFEWNWKTSLVPACPGGQARAQVQADGLQMYSKGWAPKGELKATIGLVHGHGEHIGRYEHVAAALTEKGYALLGFDLRGHGKSAGPRGHTPSYEALMNDIAAFFDQIERRYPDLPRFLYGHSLGGNLVLNYALRRKPKLRGVIASGPWLKLAFEPPASKVSLGKMMNNILPAFSQASGLETAALSHDPAVVKAYENDPLVHDKISARMFVSIYDSGLWALEHAAEFPIPLLLMHGAADRLTSAETSRRYAEAAGKNVTLRLWDGWYHEIHNEPEKAQVFKVMTDWLAANLTGQTASIMAKSSPL